MNNIHERLNVLALATSYTVQNNEPYPSTLTSSSQSVTDIKTAKVMENFLVENKKYFNIEDTENLEKIKAHFQHWIKCDPCDKECASLIGTIDEIVGEAAFIMPPEQSVSAPMHPRFAAAPRLLEDLKEKRNQFGPKDIGYLNDLLFEFTDLAIGNDVPPVVQELTLFLLNLLGELENKRQNSLNGYTLQNAGETLRSLQLGNLTYQDIPFVTSLMEHYSKLIASKTNGEDISEAIDLTVFLGRTLSSIRTEPPSLELKNARAIIEFLNIQSANITQNELNGLINARDTFVNLVGNAPTNIDLTDSLSLIEHFNLLIAKLTPAAPAAPAVTARRVNNDDDDGDEVPIVLTRNDTPPRSNYRYIEKVHFDAYDRYQETKFGEITPENVFKLATLADDHKNRDLMDECNGMLSYFLSASNKPNLKGIFDACKGLLRIEANVTVGENNTPRVEMFNFPNPGAIETLVQLDRLVDFDLVLPRRNINAEQLNALEKKLFHTTISASGS